MSLESEKRIRADWESLKEKARKSGYWTISKLQTADSGNHSINIEIRGRAISVAGPNVDRVEYNDKQLFRIEFPQDFPQAPPTIHIQSPTFHPNLPADGIVNTNDVGITWSAETPTEVLVERIWNSLRGSYMDAVNAINLGAGQWYQAKSAARPDFFPVDQRPLFQQVAGSENVVSYRKKGESVRYYRKPEPIVIDDVQPDSDESSVHFID